VQALANAITTLKAQGAEPFNLPHRLDDAGWVANRWCEILPIPLAAKHRLMLLAEPQLRLRLVDEYLRGKGVV
jgi:Lon protease-like protein